MLNEKSENQRRQVDVRMMPPHFAYRKIKESFRKV